MMLMEVRGAAQEPGQVLALVGLPVAVLVTAEARAAEQAARMSPLQPFRTRPALCGVSPR